MSVSNTSIFFPLQRVVEVFDTLILCVCVHAHAHIAGAWGLSDAELQSMYRLAQVFSPGKAACALSLLPAWAEVWTV